MAKDRNLSQSGVDAIIQAASSDDSAVVDQEELVDLLAPANEENYQPKDSNVFDIEKEIIYYVPTAKNSVLPADTPGLKKPESPLLTPYGIGIQVVGGRVGPVIIDYPVKS